MKRPAFPVARTFLYALFSLLILTAGCGGGSSDNGGPGPVIPPPIDNGNNPPPPPGGGPSVPVETRQVAVTVQWPARSRSISAPASALSLRVILRGASRDGSDFSFIINRGDSPDAFTQTYPAPDEAVVGTWQMDIQCHAEGNGAGALVGVAATQAEVRRSGETAVATVAATGLIRSVRIVPGQSVRVGQRKTLAVEARNESGTVLAVSPGSVFFTVLSGHDFLRVAEGGMQVEGIAAPGAAAVKATVDGRESDPAEVRVHDIEITIQPATLELFLGQSETFRATVSGTENQGVTWSVLEGTVGGTITEEGRYTAPAQTPGTYHVVATSKENPNRKAQATVIVRARPTDGGGDGEDNPRYIKVSLVTADLVYDPVSRLIWASVPRLAPQRSNSVASINPETGLLGDSFGVGPDPGKLALGGESQILWIGVNGEGAVRRFNINSRMLGPLFPLGADDHSWFVADDIEVAPGRPETIAVARRNREHSPRHEGVVIYDNGNARERSTDRHLGSTVLAFGPHHERLYGFNNETAEFALRRMEVSASGVLVTGVSSGVFEGENVDIKYDDGRLYSSRGRVVNAETNAHLGTFPEIGAGALVLPDSARGRVYFLTGDGPVRRLRVFDRNTYQQIAVLEIEGVAGKAGSLIRWGANGLAFRTNDGQVFIIRSIPGL